MKKDKLIPKLRFKEFVGEWEEKKVEEIFEVYDGTHQTPKYTQEGIPFVSVENIKNLNATKKYISVEAYNKDFKIKLRKDDILMTRITAGIIGDTAIVTSNKPLAYYVSLALLRRKINLDSTLFLSQRINSMEFKRELNRKIIHVAFPKKINLGDLKSCITYRPEFLEQEKIAKFLSSVDSKIENLEKKKELLETYKKGTMQKIFKQEIRFQDENGNDYPQWEEKKLGEISKIKTGKKDTQDKIANGKYPFFVRSNTVERINSFSFEGEAILTAGDGVGVGKVFHYLNEKFDYHQRVYNIHDFSKEVSGKYIYLYFSTNFYRRVMRLSAKNSVDSVRMEMISKMDIPLPCLEEQEKIANFLSSVDSKIENISKEIQKNKDFKKGLLQQMFC